MDAQGLKTQTWHLAGLRPGDQWALGIHSRLQQRPGPSYMPRCRPALSCPTEKSRHLWWAGLTCGGWASPVVGRTFPRLQSARWDHQTHRVLIVLGACKRQEDTAWEPHWADLDGRGRGLGTVGCKGQLCPGAPSPIRPCRTVASKPWTPLCSLSHHIGMGLQGGRGEGFVTAATVLGRERGQQQGASLPHLLPKVGGLSRDSLPAAHGCVAAAPGQQGRNSA